MTIILVGIIAVPVSVVVGQHFQGTMESGSYAAAMNLARFEMEKVNNMGYATIGSGVPDYDEYGYDVVRTVTYAQGDAFSAESLKEIKVDVRASGGSVVLFSLVTYIAKNVSYGI